MYKIVKKYSMAEKTATMTFESVMSDLKAGNYAPSYLLMGEEAYYIDQIADFIAEHAIKPEERDFNQQIVFGADVTGAQVADMARSYPVMAERQVIIEHKKLGPAGALSGKTGKDDCARGVL